MALTTTTCSAAIAAIDQSITVASATDFVAGRFLYVNGEFMQIRKDYSSGTVIPVLRGVEGTVPVAHAVTSNVSVGTASDFAGGVPASTKPYPQVRMREVKSYNAAGAITLPTPGNDMVAIVNGTAARALTLANPTKDMDGDKLTVVGNGKAAHTVTYTAGLGNVGAAADVITFKADQSQAIELIACGGFWVNTSLVAGAATVAGAGLA